MSNFWKSRTGAKITGDESSSFSDYFPQIPDNTQASAIIKSFTIQSYEGEDFYQIIWQLVDGDFKNAQVKQRLVPFDQKDEKAQRSLNMLMRIFNLCNIKPTHSEPPSNDDLSPMRGKILCIKIGHGIMDERPRTWVREVHAEGHLPVLSGEPVTHSKPEKSQSSLDSAFSRDADRKKDSTNNDGIPF